VLNYRQRLQEVSQREQAILGQMHTLFDILGNRRYNLPQRVDRQPMPAIDMVTGHEYEQQPQTVLNQTNRAFMFSMLPASLRDELRDLRNILSSGQPDDEQPDDDQSADVHVQLHQLANNLRARQTNDFQRNMNLFVQNIGGQRIQRLNRFLDHRAFDYGSATNLLDNLPASSPFRFRLLEALYRTADNNPSAQQNLHNESQDAHDGDLGRQEQQSWWQRLWGKIKYNSARLVRGVLRKIVGHDKLDNMVSINARYLAFIAGIRNRVQAIDRMQNDVRGIRDNVRSFVNPDRFQQIDETVIRNDVLRTHIERMAQGWQQEQPAHIEG